MRITIEDSDLLEDLARYLDEGRDTVVMVVDDRHLEVGLLGSMNDSAMRLELELRVRAWQAARRAAGRDVDVSLNGG
jgi:predicted thioesterase